MTDKIQSAQEPVPAKKIHTEEDERFFSALGYLGPLFVLTLIAKPKSQYCRFHARQSMVLFLVFFIALIVLAMIPLIGSLLMMALFALYVLAMFRSYQGDMWNIPYVSTFAGKVNVEALYEKAGLAVQGVTDMKEKAGTLAEKTDKVVEKMGEQEEESMEEESPAEESPEESPPAK